MKNDELLERVQELEACNKRVEADKAWETSLTRRVTVMLLTYLVVVIYLQYVVKIDPWVNALVPVLGFFLSTLTVSLLKSLWMRRRG